MTLTSGQVIGYLRRDRPRDRHRGPKPTAFPATGRRAGVRCGPPTTSPRPSAPGAAATSTTSRWPRPSSSPRSTSRSTRISSAPGCSSDGEPVPPDYLYESKGQRLALLQGLMDTDGNAGRGDEVEFCSTNGQLAEAVVWLATSLGQRPRRAKGAARLDGIDHGPKYRVSWRATRQVFARPARREADGDLDPGVGQPDPGPLRSRAGTADAVPHGRLQLHVPHHRPLPADPQHLPRGDTEAAVGEQRSAPGSCGVTSRRTT